MKDEPLRITCIGCLRGNPYLCVSFPGKAPAHAKDHDEWLRRRAKARQKELEAERAEARVFRRADIGADA